MGINGCEMELRLSLGRTSSCGSTKTPPSTEIEVSSGFKGCTRYIPQEHQKQITMFYNGQICACDVTEIQARAIISMAKREMDDAVTKAIQHRNMISSPPPPPPPPPSPSPMAVTSAPPGVLNSRLCMKKSLQRFLQKRKMRLDAASPYTHKKPLCLFPIKS